MTGPGINSQILLLSITRTLHASRRVSHRAALLGPHIPWSMRASLICLKGRQARKPGRRRVDAAGEVCHCRFGTEILSLSAVSVGESAKPVPNVPAADSISRMWTSVPRRPKEASAASRWRAASSELGHSFAQSVAACRLDYGRGNVRGCPSVVRPGQVTAHRRSACRLTSPISTAVTPSGLGDAQGDQKAGSEPTPGACWERFHGNRR
ncbi:hypothetical protein AHiyo1_19240 [Arthrobacter sp. Hiyo1]|nr:hypothetical protein AHiyo1_19240 [Arthrobacter sp. Hiyo1]